MPIYFGRPTSRKLTNGNNPNDTIIMSLFMNEFREISMQSPKTGKLNFNFVRFFRGIVFVSFSFSFNLTEAKHVNWVTTLIQLQSFIYWLISAFSTFRK